MSILVVAEHHEGVLEGATASVVQAAYQLDSQDIHLLVIGGEEEAKALAEQAAALAGVTKVLSASAAHLEAQLTEDMSTQIEAVLAAGSSHGGYSHVLMSSSCCGKRIMPYLAAKLDTDLVTDLTKIEASDSFVRPVYAGSLLVVERLKSPVKLLSVRASAFAPVAAQATLAPIMQVVAVAPVSAVRLLERMDTSKAARPDLARARIVVGYGRGVVKSDIPALEALADALHAAIGATRAAVDEGLAPPEYMLGQTGHIIAPELYIAVGISGAIQHLAGVKDSKIIVAINKDPNASIFQVADYGVVGDARDVLPKMIEALA